MTTDPARPVGPRELSLCPCKSRENYSVCCQPFHLGRAKPETAVQLMRSRYSAYFFRLADYLVATTHPDTREPDLKNRIEQTLHEVNWRFLTLLGSSKGGPTDKVGKVDWLFSDVICYPERLLSHVKLWMDADAAKNFVCTLKFQGAEHYSVIPAFAALPGARLMHLFNNKHELTFALLSEP